MTFWPLFFSTSLAETCDHSVNRFNCVQYLKNYDGDTVTFNIPNLHPLVGKEISIRLMGVDTPEMRTKNKCEKEKARTSKKLVASLLKQAKRIDLIDPKRGKYFRIVSHVMFDGESLAYTLVKNGLAVPYGGGSKSNIDWCLPTRKMAEKYLPLWEKEYGRKRSIANDKK